MKNRVTIKDVAAKSGYSLGTVHIALNGKPGISEETRNKILEVARELDYRPNFAAASLNRKSKRIVGCFPSAEGHNQYYYPSLWYGFQNAYAEQGRDMNVELLQCPYNSFSEREISSDAEQAGVISLNALRAELEAGTIDGMVLDGNTSPFTEAELAQFVAQGLALTMVDRDMENSGRLSCVLGDYKVIGATVAELITGRIASYGSILMCAGEPSIYSHRGIEIGFDQYLREHHCENKVYKVYSHTINEQNYQEILEAVSEPDVAAVCCVSSRTSRMLEMALEASGRAGKIYAVGSDVFAENIDAMKRNVYQNLIQKNPYAQAYTATEVLLDYLLKDQKAHGIIKVGSEVVFHSNLVFYEKRSTSSLQEVNHHFGPAMLI